MPSPKIRLKYSLKNGRKIVVLLIWNVQCELFGKYFRKKTHLFSHSLLVQTLLLHMLILASCQFVRKTNPFANTNQKNKNILLCRLNVVFAFLTTAGGFTVDCRSASRTMATTQSPLLLVYNFRHKAKDNSSVLCE